MKTLLLVSATPQHFKNLLAWIPSEAAMLQVLGPGFNFPLNPAQLLTLLNQPNRSCFALCHDATSDMLGYGELLYTEGKIRLCHLLIAPAHRNKGMGKALVKLLLSSIPKSKSELIVELHVFAWNLPALSCYKGLGFVVDPLQTTTCEIGKENWERLKMVLQTADNGQLTFEV